jgi:ribose 5-phosphate isomerase B
VTDEQRIRELVRRVVYRTVGRSEEATLASEPGHRLVTERDIQAIPAGGALRVAPDSLVTPLARQAALERRVRIEPSASPEPERVERRSPAPSPRPERTVAIGADHGGFELKRTLVELVRSLGYEVTDCGTDGPEPVDYPDVALAVAELVAAGRAARGIVVDGAGIGSCMAANKVPGVRAALCYDEATATNSREHNHANVLTLGAGLIGTALARKIVTTWLETPAGGGRHQRRVDKISEIERRFAGSRGGPR